ncbi:18633_t:CDS:2 [Acaulospora morrowiae]|uniref:18633_t:CDS:1 n=1 Tax=Acaulospora morrowiae TaxID=94023 RepID=A0A9N9A2F8_9GLOM|nr:18633_t:CDS:2 [Acaulospora morrowiae]
MTYNNTNKIFEEFEKYDFNNDANFQSGLSSILDNSKSEEEVERLIKRAKWFYFSRVFQKFDYDEYLAWQSSNSSISLSTPEEKSSSKLVPTTSDSESITVTSSDNSEQHNNISETPQYPRSFMQLAEMISNNQPIPGIKTIPDEINKGTPSNSALKPRPKPWEKIPSSS